MISQQTKNFNQDIDARVTALEMELAEIKEILSKSKVVAQEDQPSWLKVVGSFENDPMFDEAVRIGQEWRKSDD